MLAKLTTGFKTYIYKTINKRLQIVLYHLSRQYRLNLLMLFDMICQIPYVAIKINTPYMKGFPEDYPLGRDIDIVVEPVYFDEIVSVIRSYAQHENGFRIVHRQKKNNYMLRFEFGYCLHYAIEVLSSIDGLSYEFISQSIKNRHKVHNFFVTDVSFEVIYRLNELSHHPHKNYHLEYVKDHIEVVDRSLLEKYGMLELMKKFIAESERNIEFV